MAADGAAAVEALRAELVRAKERIRLSDVAAKEASVELKAEQVARCQGEEKVSMMTLALENAAGCCEFLERENEALTVELDKARQEAREARSESRALREEVRQGKEIVAGKPFLLRKRL